MADPRIRKLHINTNVLKRLLKEKDCYQSELLVERARLAKIVNDGGDEYVVRKQEQVISETEMLFPDCEKRIKNAIETLTNLVSECENDLKEEDNFLAAQTILSALPKK